MPGTKFRFSLIMLGLFSFMTSARIIAEPERIITLSPPLSLSLILSLIPVAVQTADAF